MMSNQIGFQASFVAKGKANLISIDLSEQIIDVNVGLYSICILNIGVAINAKTVRGGAAVVEKVKGPELIHDYFVKLLCSEIQEPIIEDRITRYRPMPLQCFNLHLLEKKTFQWTPSPIWFNVTHVQNQTLHFKLVTVDDEEIPLERQVIVHFLIKKVI